VQGVFTTRSTIYAETQEHAVAKPRAAPLPTGPHAEALGQLAGVAHTTVQRLESLERGAYPQTVRKLATALGLEPEALLGGDQR
jgi:hypothetical protein